MRVIAGEFKGRNLQAPMGMGTRPTTDRVKESFISSLISAYGALDGVNALDAFAGSGALGIECLSRGASSVTFFEQDKAALDALNANISMLKLPQDRARIRRADVLANPPLYGLAFDIVILDPPYAYPTEEIWSFVLTLRDKGMLARDAVISYEHSSKVDVAGFIEASAEPTTIHASKVFGKTKTGFVLFSFNDEAESAK